VAAILGTAMLARPADGVWRLDELAVWRAGGATVVALDGPSPAAVLQELRRLRVGRIDLLVIRSSSRATASAIGVLEARHPIGRRIEPGSGPAAVTVGGMRVRLAPESTGRLAVTVEGAGELVQLGAPRVRGPPRRRLTQRPRSLPLAAANSSSLSTPL